MSEAGDIEHLVGHSWGGSGYFAVEVIRRVVKGGSCERFEINVHVVFTRPYYASLIALLVICP